MSIILLYCLDDQMSLITLLSLKRRQIHGAPPQMGPHFPHSGFCVNRELESIIFGVFGGEVAVHLKLLTHDQYFDDEDAAHLKSPLPTDNDESFKVATIWRPHYNSNLSKRHAKMQCVSWLLLLLLGAYLKSLNGNPL